MKDFYVIIPIKNMDERIFKMKKIFAFIISIIISCSCTLQCLAFDIELEEYIIPQALSDEGYILSTRARVYNLECDGNIVLKMGDLKELDENVVEMMSEYINDEDEVIFTELNAYNGEKKISIDSTENMKIHFYKRMAGGFDAKSVGWGENYRVFRIDDNLCTQLEITNYGISHVNVKTDKLGLFAIVYTPKKFHSIFYSDYNTDNTEPTYQGDIYYETSDTYDNNTKLDILKPIKEGYTFVKWSDMPYTFESWEDMPQDIDNPLCEGKTIEGEWFAYWVKNEEYEPLEVLVSTPSKIYCGREDGKKIILSISHGIWVDEIAKDDFVLIGCDGVLVDNVERKDDKTVVLVLSDKSEVTTKKVVVSVSFPQEYIKDADRYQLNENGTVKKQYTTDNAVTFFVKKTSSGSSGGRTVTTVKPTVVPISTESPIISPTAEPTILPTSLPAEKLKRKKTSIDMFIGSKQLIINGEKLIMDVAPQIKDDFAVIPVRYLAEGLGFEVVWYQGSQTITIKTEESEIEFVINSPIAYANGQKTELKTSPFIENGRTFVPIRFIAEILDADVIWYETERKVGIVR